MKLKNIGKAMKYKKGYTLGVSLILIGVIAIVINALNIDWAKVWPIACIIIGVIICIMNFVDNEM